MASGNDHNRGHGVIITPARLMCLRVEQPTASDHSSPVGAAISLG